MSVLFWFKASESEVDIPSFFPVGRRRPRLSGPLKKKGWMIDKKKNKGNITVSVL